MRPGLSTRSWPYLPDLRRCPTTEDPLRADPCPPILVRRFQGVAQASRDQAPVRRPASRRPRLEPRSRWPRGSACACRKCWSRASLGRGWTSKSHCLADASTFRSCDCGQPRRSRRGCESKRRAIGPGTECGQAEFVCSVAKGQARSTASSASIGQSPPRTPRRLHVQLFASTRRTRTHRLFYQTDCSCHSRCHKTELG